MKHVPILLILSALAGCAASPAPRPLPGPSVEPPPLAAPDIRWDGSGGAIGLREPGEQLADMALRLRGLPYRYGGATREGFDCSGLVFFAHRQLGLTVPRTSREQARQADEVKQRKLRPGDLVFFKIGSRHVNHVGVYIGERQFVHAPGKGKSVTVNSLDDEYYERRFSSAGRFWEQLSR